MDVRTFEAYLELKNLLRMNKNVERSAAQNFS